MIKPRSAFAFGLPIALVIAACSSGAADAPLDDEATAKNAEALVSTSSADLRSDRKGLGLLAPAPASASTLTQNGFDPRRSLAVTDERILGNFTLKAVLDQIASTSGTPGLDGAALFRQWWDTQGVAPGSTLSPHCNDQTTNGVPSINGFPYDCPRAERAEVGSTPFDSGPTGYMPIGLFNRFDLADLNGADCGEYRIVFARRSGQSNAVARNLLIFEAQMPNPTPGDGVKGCYPIAKFWWDLSADPNVTSRGTSLKNFYFTGLPGFEPVIHANHYGAGPSGGGQIRSNQFMQGPWILREFKTAQTCVSGSCGLRIVPSIDKVNPAATLFNGTDATSTAFQNELIAQLGFITISDINRFDYAPSARFNTAQSKEQGSENDYRVFLSSAPASFRNGIQATLSTMGRTFTAEQVVNRVEALSCAGCHQLSGNADLGGGLTFPQSLGFTHVTEQSPEDTLDGGRFRISPALTNVFLPFRQQVLFDYLASWGPKPPPTPCTKLIKNCCGDLMCPDDAKVCPFVCRKPLPTE